MANNNLDTNTHEVVFYTYPKYIFCWPLIALGFIMAMIPAGKPVMITADAGLKKANVDPCAVAVDITPEESTTSDKETAADQLKTHFPRLEVMAWIWGIALVIILLTLGFDLNRNYTVFWLVLIGAVWMLILWLKDARSVTIFGDIYHFFADLNPQYSRPFGFMVSIVLLVFWAIMWIWSRLNSKWRITHNEFEHYQFGRMDDSLARGAKRVSTTYPDFFELLLCLAGELIIFDPSGRRELRRIPHVPLLPIVRRKIDKILETTAVISSDVDDESEAYEDTEEDTMR